MKNGKKSKENLIGKIINGFLLFMPLLAIGITCGYAIFNKNAYQSYGDKYVEVYSPVNQASMLVENSIYQVVYTENTGYSYWFDVKDTNLYDYFDFGTKTVQRIYFISQSTPRINIDFTDSTNMRIDNWQNTTNTFTFTLDTTNYNTLNPISFATLNLVVFNERQITDVFYYSIDKVEQSPLFNWSTNTGLYSVLNSTCNTLGITTTFIPMLLAYWLLTSLMYLIYDIALIMVHMAHNKIHEFEGSL